MRLAPVAGMGPAAFKKFAPLLPAALLAAVQFPRAAPENSPPPPTNAMFPTETPPPPPHERFLPARGEARGRGRLGGGGGEAPAVLRGDVAGKSAVGGGKADLFLNRPAIGGDVAREGAAIQRQCPRSV